MHDQKKFELIYKEYHRLVRGVLFNMAGGTYLDDLTQETFVKIWKGLPRFALRSTVKTWIYRITLNTAIDHLRKAKPATTEYIDEDHSTNTTLKNDLSEAIQTGLMLLDEPHRSLVILYYFEELEIKQIANILEIPTGTVKSRLHTAKQKLKSTLEGKGVLK